MEITDADVMKVIRDERYRLIAKGLLSHGYSKETLEALINIAISPQSDAELQLARMNLIGGLRASGFEVTGGRGGGTVYRIVGRKPPTEALTREQLPQTIQDELAVWEGMPVTQADFFHMRDLMAMIRVHEQAHELSPAYVDSYELASAAGFRIPRARTGLLLRKHVNIPRWRIFAIDLDTQYLYDLAGSLISVSFGKITVVNLHRECALALRKLDPKGTVSKRVQAMYNLEAIAEDPKAFLGRKLMSRYRIVDSVTELRDSDDTQKMLQVVYEWKRTNERKHRQLAIGRDYRAIRSLYLPIRLLGMRADKPVALGVFSCLPGRPDTVNHLVEKSLNYADQPGGMNGTSDWLMVASAKELVKTGIKWLNGGTYLGGGEGLPHHKARFADPKDDYVSYEFTFSYEPLRKDKL